MPGFVSTTLAFVPANRPPSAPGVTTPVSKEPSSAEKVWGLPPTLATSTVDPALTLRVSGLKRRRSPGRAGSMASTRLTAAPALSPVTVMTPFILDGLMRQK